MSGQVVIHKQAEPNAQGFLFYMTGFRNTVSQWDDDGNYYSEGFLVKEEVRQRFNTKEEAIKYANDENYEYIVM